MPVVVRRNPEDPKKCPAQTEGRAKAAVVRDFLQFVLRFLQPAPGRFDTNALHKTRWRCACILQKDASEIARTHASPGGQLFHRQRLVEIVEGPGTNFFDLFPVRGLERKGSAVLRLTSSPAQVQDHLACDLQRHWCSKVLFDQSQRKVHTGCDSCRGVGVSIAYVYGIWIDSCVLKLSCQFRRPLPMCRDTLSIQEPRRCKHKSSGTD